MSVVCYDGIVMRFVCWVFMISLKLFLYYIYVFAPQLFILTRHQFVRGLTSTTHPPMHFELSNLTHIGMCQTKLSHRVEPGWVYHLSLF